MCGEDNTICKCMYIIECISGTVISNKSRGKPLPRIPLLIQYHQGMEVCVCVCVGGGGVKTPSQHPKL